MSNIDKIKLIEAYHTGKWEAAERKSFERLMSEDPNFRKEVNAYEPIFDGFRALKEDDFVQNLQNFEQAYQAQQQQKNTSIVRFIRPLYYVAAAAAIILMSTLAYQLTRPNLFDQNFVASESIAVHVYAFRAADDISVAEQLKKEAFSAYQNKNYATCIRLLEDYKQNFPSLAHSDYQALVVLGVAQLARGKAEVALASFNEVITSRDSSYRQEAEWMTALANIKLQQNDKAKTQLIKISKRENHLHQQKAITLLGKL